MNSAALSFGPSPEVQALKERLKGLSHREICELLHASYHRVNGVVEMGYKASAEDRAAKTEGERTIRLATQELRSRGLRFEPVYECLNRVTVTETGEVFDVWHPYHAVRPHPNFPSGRPTRNDLMSNFHELEAALEAIRPGLSKEKREPVKFVTTRRRAS